MLGAAVLCLLGASLPARAVRGIPDKVYGSSLLVPYFEVAVDPAGARDTLLAVNTRGGATIVHLVVWDRDGRKALDARACVAQLADGAACTGHGSIGMMSFRVFGAGGNLAGRSDLVAFTWLPGTTGGPSVYCDTHGCLKQYDYERIDESGAVVESRTLRLDHVVNVIAVDDPAVSGTASIFNVPSNQRDLQFFHFSINQANPVGHPELTFDALFEGDVN